jgi:hypothetical protein
VWLRLVRPPRPRKAGGEGDGPIDCIYVAGPDRDRFTEARKADSPFGSDHFAVSTVLTGGDASRSAGPGGEASHPPGPDRGQLNSVRLAGAGGAILVINPRGGRAKAHVRSVTGRDPAGKGKGLVGTRGEPHPCP